MIISLKYCSAWGYEPQALSLTGKLVEQFKTKLKGVTLIPDRGGCFEVTVNGDLIYSKLQTDEFPRESAILDEVGRRLKASAA